MIPEKLAIIIILLSGLIAAAVFMIAVSDRKWRWLLITAILGPISIFVGFKVQNAYDRVEKTQPTYYSIKEAGTVDNPAQVSVVRGSVFDITELFNIVLYNPELYYLEEQKYICPCKGWCLVTVKPNNTYRIVPRSLVEIQ